MQNSNNFYKKIVKGYFACPRWSMGISVILYQHSAIPVIRASPWLHRCIAHTVRLAGKTNVITHIDDLHHLWHLWNSEVLVIFVQALFEGTVQKAARKSSMFKYYSLAQHSKE